MNAEEQIVNAVYEVMNSINAGIELGDPITVEEFVQRFEWLASELRAILEQAKQSERPN